MTTIYLTLYQATLPPGATQPLALTAYAGTSLAIQITLTDESCNPVNLSGKTVKLVTFAPLDASTILQEFATTIGGASSNVISVTISPSTIGVFSWSLVDVTDGAALLNGTLTVPNQPIVNS